MTEHASVQYVGFEAKALVREYKFLVGQALNGTRKFVLTIMNEPFYFRSVRNQDAPEICSMKLRRELAAFANHPPQTHYVLAK